MYQSVYIVVYFNKVTIMFKRRDWERVTLVLSCSEVLECSSSTKLATVVYWVNAKRPSHGVRFPGRWETGNQPQRPLKIGENVSGTLQVEAFFCCSSSLWNRQSFLTPVAILHIKSIWESRQQAAAAVTIGTEERRRARRWQREAEQPQDAAK